MNNIEHRLFDGNIFVAKKVLPTLTSYTIALPETWDDDQFRHAFNHVYQFPKEEADRKMGIKSDEYPNDLFWTFWQKQAGKGSKRDKLVGYLSAHELSPLATKEQTNAPALFGRGTKETGAFPSRGTWTYHIHAFILEPNNEALADRMLKDIEHCAAEQRYFNISVAITAANDTGMPFFSSRGYEILGHDTNGNIFMIKRGLPIPHSKARDYRRNEPDSATPPILKTPGTAPTERPTSPLEDFFKD